MTIFSSNAISVNDIKDKDTGVIQNYGMILLQESLYNKTNSSMVKSMRDFFNLKKNDVTSRHYDIEYQDFNDYIYDTINEYFDNEDKNITLKILMDIEYSLMNNYQKNNINLIFNKLKTIDTKIIYQSMVLMSPKNNKDNKLRIFKQSYDTLYENDKFISHLIKFNGYIDKESRCNFINQETKLKPNKITTAKETFEYEKNFKIINNIMLLLSINSIANTEKIPLSPTPLSTPSYWYKFTTDKSSLSSLDDSVKKICNDNEKIGKVFHNTAKTANSARCVFNLHHFISNTSIEIHECVFRSYERFCD